MSDYFLCVVNDFTSLDQRYLDKLTRNLQNSNKPFREVRTPLPRRIVSWVRRAARVHPLLMELVEVASSCVRARR